MSDVATISLEDVQDCEDLQDAQQAFGAFVASGEKSVPFEQMKKELNL